MFSKSRFNKQHVFELIGKRVVDFSVNITFLPCVTAKELGENRSKTGVLKAGGLVWAKFSHRKGRPPPTIFAQIVRPMRKCVADFLQANCEFTPKTTIIRF